MSFSRHRIDPQTASVFLARKDRVFALGFRLRDGDGEWLAPAAFDRFMDALTTSAKYAYRQQVLPRKLRPK